MENLIVVEKNEDEARVALVENERVAEIHIERYDSRRIVGNIYRGRVENVLPGMQAAFVNIGVGKNAFLYVDDALPGGIHGDHAPGTKIEDCLREGQEIMVQVSKEALGTKGPRITRQLTLPGRYVVLMPDVCYTGISRKIEDIGERNRLERICAEMTGLKNGIIVRTVAEGVGDEELRADYAKLLQDWEHICRTFENASAPETVHVDQDLTRRFIRDLLNEENNHIIVSSRDMYDQTKKFLSQQELDAVVDFSEEDIFEQLNVDREIMRALSRKVWLKSGCYLIFDRTEALTSIDVNTGKYIGKKDLGETIFRANTEAAYEICHQVRLRNLSGIIIIDFIDMKEQWQREEILAILSREFKKDRVKVHVIGMTQLGLVEITRKKMRSPLHAVLEEECECCAGRGHNLSVASLVIQIKREVRRRAARIQGDTIEIKASPTVAAELIGSEGAKIRRFSREVHKKILVQSSENLAVREYHIN